LPPGHIEANERVEFLVKAGISAKDAPVLLEKHLQVEQRPAESVWDMAQVITLQAQQITFNDARVECEGIASRILEKVAA
jgi:hypothetical protein